MTLALAADGGLYAVQPRRRSRHAPPAPPSRKKTVRGSYKMFGNTLELKTSTGELTKHTVMPLQHRSRPRQSEAGRRNTSSSTAPTSKRIK